MKGAVIGSRAQVPPLLPKPGGPTTGAVGIHKRFRDKTNSRVSGLRGGVHQEIVVTRRQVHMAGKTTGSTVYFFLPGQIPAHTHIRLPGQGEHAEAADRLVDGVQWVDFNIMSEGDKAKFQRKTNRDITVNQKTNDAKIKLDPAEERHELIKQSVCDWYMFAPNPHQGGRMEPVPFSLSDTRHPSGMCLERWLSLANPKLVEDLELAIRKANPWMQADMTVEAIDEEIKRLEELRIETVRRNQGN